MSMLDRYRKPGGFLQLLALIETCAPSKQEKLLDIIAAEDLRWSEAVRSKMLSITRVYSWSDEALMEIFGTLQDLTVSVAMHAAEEPLKSRIGGFLTHGRRRKIEDVAGMHNPTPNEIAAQHMKIVESVRKMETDGYIRFEKIDPLLVIDENIDDRLSQAALPYELKSIDRVTSVTETSLAGGGTHGGTGFAGTGGSPTPLAAVQSHDSAPPSGAGGGESRLLELQALKKRVAELSKENATLRHELSIARSKLDQIKKIA